MSTWRTSTTSTLPSYRKRLYSYAVLWGILTFIFGIGISLVTLPDSFDEIGIETWRIASWIWLNAHGVGIEGTQVGGLDMAFQTVNLVQDTPQLHMIRVVPVLLVAICGLLVTATMGGTTNDKHILENAVAAVGGYLLAGLTTVIISGARPGVGLVAGLVVVLAGALYVGSVVADRLPIPVFAVTSLSGIAGVGLFVLLAAGVVSTVVVPLGKHAIAGGVIATVGLWVSKNLD